MTTLPLFHASNHVYVQSSQLHKCHWHIGLFSNPCLLPTVAHWMLSLREKGTTSAAFLTESSCCCFLKSTLCKWFATAAMQSGTRIPTLHGTSLGVSTLEPRPIMYYKSKIFFYSTSADLSIVIGTKIRFKKEDSFKNSYKSDSSSALNSCSFKMWGSFYETSQRFCIFIEYIIKKIIFLRKNNEKKCGHSIK